MFPALLKLQICTISSLWSDALLRSDAAISRIYNQYSASANFSNEGTMDLMAADFVAVIVSTIAFLFQVRAHVTYCPICTQLSATTPFLLWLAPGTGARCTHARRLVIWRQPSWGGLSASSMRMNQFFGTTFQLCCFCYSIQGLHLDDLVLHRGYRTAIVNLESALYLNLITWISATML